MRNQELLPMRIAFIRRIVDHHKDIGKTKIQKITYFLQKSVGVSLKYPFRMHYYGPYSDELDNALSWANALGYVDIKPDLHGFGYHVMSAQDGDIAWESEYDISQAHDIQKIDRVIDILGDLETYELELYATIHLIGGPGTYLPKKEAIATVKRLKPKFSEEMISSAYMALKNTSLI